MIFFDDVIWDGDEDDDDDNNTKDGYFSLVVWNVLKCTKKKNLPQKCDIVIGEWKKNKNYVNKLWVNVER